MVERKAAMAERKRLIGFLEDENVDAICKVELPGNRKRWDVYVFQPGLGQANEQDETRIITHRRPFQPLGFKMGTSTSNDLECGAGTLGIAATDNQSKKSGYITCRHVAQAKNGCYQGEGFVQYAPATCDSPKCSAQTQIGQIVRVAPLAPRSMNVADAAFVESKLIDPENDCGLCATSTTPADPTTLEGETIMKCGRSTRLTCGVVTSGNCVVKIPYSAACKDLWYINQIVVETRQFSVVGDSGAVAYTSAGVPVGLVFAGDGETITFLNPLNAVLNELDVSLIAQSCNSQPECPKENSVVVIGCPGGPPP
jgi:hypothetical protein